LSQLSGLLLAHESYAYTTLWESFAINQRRFLTGWHSEPPGIRAFASDLYPTLRLTNLHRMLKGPLSRSWKRDMIDRDNGSFIIIDRFFKIWIQKTQSV